MTVSTIRRVAADGSLTPVARPIAVEMPVAVSFNGIGYAVMMATPADLDDFAYGFAHAERLIAGPGDVIDVRSHEVREDIGGTGMLLDIILVPSCAAAVTARVRHRVADSGCGICGIENLEAALRPLPRLVTRPLVGTAAIFAALTALPARQPLNAATGAIHAAAFVEPDGQILTVREDVGRHNALDKLIGALMVAGIDPATGAILLTSRCSYELVEKTALAGCPMLVTVSAPTSLAQARAEAAGLTLIALARADAMLVMTDPHGLFAS